MAASCGFRSRSAAVRRASFLVVGSLVTASSVDAQPTLSRRFAADAGLPASPVWALAQDRTGFLWVGTEGGLVRFDGREFRAWAPEVIRIAVIAVAVSPAGEVVALDARGRLFQVTADGARGLPVPAGAPHRSLRPLVFDHGGRLWMIRGGDLVMREPGGRWTRLPRATIGEERPLVVGSADHGGILVATDSSVWRLEADGTARRLLGRGPVIDVLQLEDGEVAALGYGLHIIDGAGSRELAGPGTWEMPPGRPIALVERGSTLWVALDRHLVALRPGHRPEVWGPLDGLEAGGPMLVDREGSLWVGTFTALLQFPEPETRIWNDRHGLPSAHTRFLGETDGTLWITTWHGASHLRRNDPAGERMIPFGPHSTSRLCPDPDGALWMSTSDGLLRLRGEAITARHPDIGTLLGCAPTREGGLWLASSRGLWRTTDSFAAVTPVASPPELDGRSIEAVLEDRGGRMWVGTEGSICARDSDPAGAWDCDRPGETGKITGLLQFPSGRIWAATERMGVLRYEPGGWTPLLAADRLPTRAVFGLRPGRTGGVWVFGHGFMFRVQEQGATDEGWRVVERLGGWHGLPAAGGGDLLEEADGTLWIATSLGVVQIPPQGRYAEPEPPAVALVEARSGTDPLPAASARLSHRRNQLELRFAALSFRDPAWLDYQVRLSPNRTWTATAGPPSFQWPELRPGRYHAEFRASLGGREWSPEPATFTFQVLPPWYREPWAMAGFALLAFAGLWGAHRVRTNFLVRLERQRTRIAMDLHDQIGSGLGSVGILAGIVAREGVEADSREALARQIAQTAEELGTSLSDIIWSLDPQAGTLHELAARLSEHGQRLFAEEAVEFAVRFPDAWPEGDLPVQVRRNVLLIGLEAMYNAARHARPRRVTLALRPVGRAWALVVRDDGAGLPGARHAGLPGARHARPAGHGLKAMRARAAEIDAELRISSAPGRGTTVSVRFGQVAPGDGGRRRRFARFRAARRRRDPGSSGTGRPRGPVPGGSSPS